MAAAAGAGRLPLQARAGTGPCVRTYIVEDSPAVLGRLVGLLEELAPVRVVGSATDEASANLALARLADGVDLVIIDMFLTSGSGLGVLRAAHAAGRQVTLVVLTNFASPDLRRRCTGMGAHRVFDKSNDIDALVDYCIGLDRPPPGGTGQAIRT